MNKRVIYCHCGGDFTPIELKESILRFLESEKIESIKLSDLCGLCALNKNLVRDIFTTKEPTLLIACHPRAVKKILEFAGADSSLDNVEILNIRENTKEEIFTAIKSLNQTDQLKLAEFKADPEWPSWYPVIDYSRCTGCGQCADFCLFGVYEKTENTVSVVNPQGCKNNCPACARICPHAAIVFPKYKLGGAISGSDSIDEVAEMQRQQQDLKTILGSDIYKALEQRKAKRQSIIKTEAMKKALEERENAKRINN